jgi:insertion element IS1 protein InsB
MVLSYVFRRRKDGVFKELKASLKPLNIQRYYTDDWGAYEHLLMHNSKYYLISTT